MQSPGGKCLSLSESTNASLILADESISTMSLTIGFVEKGLEQQSLTSAFNYIHDHLGI